MVAVDTARQAAKIARQQMLAGTADVTAVLTAEAALFTAEDTLGPGAAGAGAGAVEFV